MNLLDTDCMEKTYNGMRRRKHVLGLIHVGSRVLKEKDKNRISEGCKYTNNIRKICIFVCAHECKREAEARLGRWYESHSVTVNGTKRASPERFEHSRSKTNRLTELKLVAGDPVNHSGKVTMMKVKTKNSISSHSRPLSD